MMPILLVFLLVLLNPQVLEMIDAFTNTDFEGGRHQTVSIK
jgi:ribose 5-phosphate isomerase RpiB